MRINLSLSPNTELCPFNYQGHLVYKFHKWLGENAVHDDISLYSMSWLHNGKRRGRGLDFRDGAKWFISGWDDRLVKKLVQGIQTDPELAFGMYVDQIQLADCPNFSQRERFLLASPIFIKRTIGEEEKFYYHSDRESNDLLTETLVNKMKQVNIEGPVRVTFDSSYASPKIKMVTYKGTHRKASMCPVILEGSPEAIRFAWHVGIGNGTGIGFGALVEDQRRK